MKLEPPGLAKYESTGKRNFLEEDFHNNDLMLTGVYISLISLCIRAHDCFY